MVLTFERFNALEIITHTSKRDFELRSDVLLAYNRALELFDMRLKPKTAFI